MTELLKEMLKVNQHAPNIDLALLFIRLAIGMLMLRHGIPKARIIFAREPIRFFKTFGLSEANSFKLAAFTEIFFSICLMLGLGTLIAVIPLFVTMAIASFYTLRGQPFDKKELPVLFLMFYFTILLCGGGRFSLDYVLFGFK
ncbi:DoxX family protein [Chitinophaga sancti]|uniref:DoxX family protein n=1 Tax=Chitinophaga sancti TaxID=1004 RepID=A0A1K1SKN8_9BACT|nr:DoxX family protein [Chitinophaga sancti]WQD65472.1 DoxX family protein [Chitinophaga sancti]WQG88905.1 DoxX family protein [Chitinophaga sancti]SFW84882.1 putative oxidoreductase [Chitinophaga sancti]